MRTLRTILPGLAMLGLLSATPTGAQESTTRGFMIGAHLSGASLTVEDEERNNAGGGGFVIGYGLNRRFTIFAQVDGAQFDEQSTGNVEGDWTMGHADLGVRFHFANSLSAWVPYLQAAFGYRAVAVQDPIVNGTTQEEVEISGPGFTLGGGLDFYFTETVALDVQLLWTGGEFTTLRVNNTSQTGFDVDARSTRFNVGVVWWP